MSAKQNTLIDELRKKELKGLSEAEFQGVKAEVESKGVRGLTGSAAKIVFGALQDREKAVKKHQEHDQSSHGSWAGTGGSMDSGNMPRKVSGASGGSKQGSIATTPGILDKLFGKGEIIEGDEFERKVTESWGFEMKNPTTGKTFQAAVYDFMRYDEMGLTSEQGQTLSPLGRSERFNFSIGAQSKSDAAAVQDYITSNSTGLANYYLGDGEKTPGMSPFGKATSVAQGDMVSWKSGGGSATGKVIRVVREGVLAVPESSFKLNGEAENPAVLIQLYRDGKPTDTKVGHKMSTLSKSVDVEKASSVGVKNKAEEHNAEYGDVAGKRTTAAILQQVYNRGVGAYKTNPSSVRPSVGSEQQWAMGRVNGFLHALRTGRFKRSPYDTDLLPEEHSLSSKGKEKEEKKDK